MDKMSYSQVEGILYNYKLIKASIANNELKLENLELDDEEMEDGVSAISYEEPSSKTNKFNSVVENATIKNIKAKDKAKAELRKTITRESNKIKMIDNALAALPETERKIIELFYIEDLSWWKVAAEVCYSEGWCKEKRKETIERILYTINGNGKEVSTNEQKPDE